MRTTPQPRPEHDREWAERVQQSAEVLLTEDQWLYRDTLHRFIVKDHHGAGGTDKANTDRADLAIGATLCTGRSMYDRHDIRKSVTTSIKFNFNSLK